MLHYEISFIDKVSSYVEAKQGQEMIEEFSRKSILNCFSKISMTKTAEVKFKFPIYRVGQIKMNHFS